MNKSETAALLAMCAVYDNRTIGEADVIGWQAVLADIELEDARRAVVAFYSSETERRIMPAYVKKQVAQIRNERAARNGVRCTVEDCGCRGKQLVPMPPTVRRAIAGGFRNPGDVA